MKDKPIIDNILKTIARKIEDEVSALLGYQIAISAPENRVVTKGDYFTQAAGNLVLTDLKVTGDREGTAYLALSIRDAILLGGTLLMLPPKELENRVENGEFDEEAADAFGEIANIITGVSAAVFDDLYSGKLHLTKVGLQMVVPKSVDLESADPIPSQSYYLSSAVMKMEERPLGSLQILFPLDILGWEVPAGEEAAASAAAPEKKKSAPPVDKTGAGGQEEDRAAPPQKKPAVEQQGKPVPEGKKPAPDGEKTVKAGTGPPEVDSAAGDEGEVVLVVTDDPQEGALFSESLEEMGLQVKVIDAQGNIKAQLPDDGIRGVFLVLKNVSEQGIALVIKVRSACGNASPLVAAGPNWTRNAVIQAVKYGACDIVVTPSTSEEIREKAEVRLGLRDSAA